MTKFAKNKIKPYRSNVGYINPEFAWLFETKEHDVKTSGYSGRRIFRIQNRNKIRQIMDAAHHKGNF